MRSNWSGGTLRAVVIAMASGSSATRRRWWIFWEMRGRVVVCRLDRLRLPLPQQPLRRDQLPTGVDGIGDVAPVGGIIDPDTNPARLADIGWHKEAIGISAHHHTLDTRSRLAPDGRPAAAVMIAGRGEHHEHLVAHPEGGLAPRLDLVRLGQGQADLADSAQR